MKQGDIVIVPFPFTDLSDSKKRPALVISNESFNKERNIMLIAVSTKKGVSKHAKTLFQDNLQEGVLNKDSFLRFHNMFVLEKRIVIKKVAKLKNDYLEEVKKRFIGYVV